MLLILSLAATAHASGTWVVLDGPLLLPHPGQRPSQPGVVCPQDSQTWTVRALAMPTGNRASAEHAVGI